MNFGDGSPMLPTQDEYSCSNCDRTVSATAKSCPYCHVHFDYTEEADGSRRYSGRGIAGLVKLGIGAVVLVVGGIVALIRKLSG